MATSRLNSVNSGGGIDVQAFVDQIIYAERAPVRMLQTQQTQFNAQAAAIKDLSTKLSTLQTSVDGLQDISGKFNTKSVATSNDSILSATASASAAAGTHTVTIASLAATSSYYTDQLASVSTAFSSGSFSLQLGASAPVTITVDDAHNTLEGLVAHINSLDLGVTASVITDANGARLSLVSDSSGAASDLTVSSNTTGLVFNKGVTGTNASLTVDGVPVESASNTVSGVIAGVTLTLSGKTGADPVSVTVKPDSSQSRQGLEDFVTGYNDLITTINSQFTYNATTQKAGVLAGDSSLRLVQQQLLGAVRFSVSGNGGIVNLSSMGIEVNDDGTLAINSSKLDGALADHFREVQNFLQTITPAGFARNFASALDALGDSVDGPLNVALAGVNRTLDTVGDQISDFESRLELRRQSLTEQYSRLDASLQQMTVLLSQVSTQLSSLK